LVSGDRIEARYGQINAFERHLAENDVTILKSYLHISKKEQKARLQARLDDPTKRWKFSPADLAERKHWHDYVTAYRIALERCSTEWAPWFIVPADRKWYRNAVVARIADHGATGPRPVSSCSHERVCRCRVLDSATAVAC
jgi:polyphosphate kinase 2 (PPK2 family)